MTSPSAENLHLLSRNPVFTAAKSVWGYEVQAASVAASDLPPDGDGVGAAVVAGDYVGLKSIVARNKKMLLAYSREQLEQLVPRAIPPQSSAILLGPDGQRDPGLAEPLARLVREGHTLALEWDPQCTPASPCLDLAAMVCLAGPAMAADAALHDVLTRGPGRTCLARNVVTRCEAENLQALGVTLFQGRFFKTAEIIPGRKLSSHQNSRLQLLRLIEGEDPDVDALARTIQADVSLSYRLLSYLNSPAFGFMRKIDSIRQAITLLGWINVRNWLRAVLMADMAQGEIQGEVLHVSLWRGRFLEQLVAKNDFWNFRPDEMFLMGMFSLLDAILGVTMPEALACLPLTEAQKKALTAAGPTEYAPLLTLLPALEDGEGQGSDRMLQDLSLDPDAVRRLHLEAGAWAAAILDLGPRG